MADSIAADNMASAGTRAPPTAAGAPPVSGNSKIDRAASRDQWNNIFRRSRGFLPSETSLSIIAVGVTILTLIAIGHVLQDARTIMLPLASALVLAILLAPASDFLARLGLPEAVRAAILVFGSLITLSAAFYYLGKPAVSFVEQLPRIAEDARDKLAGVEKVVTQVHEVSRQVEELTEIGEDSEQPDAVIIREQSFSDVITQSARSVVIQILFTAVMTYFLLSTRKSFRLKAIAARKTLPGKLHTARIFCRIQKHVGSYMFTMVIINLGLGFATAGAMAAIGMPSPLIWGLIAGILNFIPYLGPIIVAVLLALSGIVTYETLRMAIVPPLIYITFNFIESNFVTPLLVGVRLLISPLAIVVSVALFTFMWGPVGAVIAIPLVVILKTVFDSIEALEPLGVAIGELRVIRGRKMGLCRVESSMSTES